MRTQVAVIGGGPSGLMLAEKLAQVGIETVIIERQTRAHVLGRIRAGVLEQGLVDILHDLGAGARLRAQGLLHHGTVLSDENTQVQVDFTRHAGRPVVVYGQTELTRDLYDLRDKTGGPILFECSGVELHDLDRNRPYVTFQQHGQSYRLECDYVAGCDGFHGVSRTSIPAAARTEYERVYPFGWLGVLSETPPVHSELIYASSDRGFALCSQRNANLSRYYIQCDLSDRADHWSDAAFWDELRRRIPAAHAQALITGPSIEKSIAPLRSFVCAPMQWGRLFLCGDAAHIVPPTGAKGLNSAAADVHYLSQGLIARYTDKDEALLSRYSEQALARVWKTQRFSWWMTKLLHRFPDQDIFERQIQRAELALLAENEAAQAAMAQNYVGLPY